MKISEVLSEKKKYSSSIKKTYGLLQKHNPLCLIKLTNKELINDLIDGLGILPAGFIIEYKGLEKVDTPKNTAIIDSIKNDNLIGFDFILCDSDLDNLNTYFEKGITPLIIKDNHLGSVLSEFSALKSEGNAFFYNSMDKWSIFYTIVRYMENFKFPYDNRTLVKNVLDI